MFSAGNCVLLSRVAIPLLGLPLWSFCVLVPRSAYRFPEKRLHRVLMALGVFGVFVLQVNLMNRLAPEDAHGIYFHRFIMIEGGGALFLSYFTRFRERARSRRVAQLGAAKRN
jgi:hypothetical protein